MRIVAHPRLSAIYFALLQCGYDYHALSRDSAHADALRPFAAADVPDFFRHVRQNTCGVYPYWPRAALLETAALALTEDGRAYQDWDGLKQRILLAPNLTPQERDESLFTWLQNFPAALRQVMDCPEFRAYCAWEDRWLDAQSALHAPALHHIAECADACIRRYQSPVTQLDVVINPIKCAYSADHHLLGSRFLFVSGALRADSVIHELLHHAVHPAVIALAEDIPDRRWPDLDESYFAAGPLYSFEEHAVRALTEDFLHHRAPDHLLPYLTQLLAKEENP